MVEDCYNTGEISIIGDGYIRAGGISGAIWSTEINRCYNLGDITGINKDSDHYQCIDIYGIGGYTINNCYNAGDIYGKLGNVDNNSVNMKMGGLTVQNATNSYNIGNVSAFSKSPISGGTTAGTITSNTNINSAVNSYYLDNIKVLADNVIENGEAVSKEYMKSEEFYDKLNADGVWVYRKNRYPVLSKVINANIVPSTEISIENTVKNYKITTEVENNIGGDISGKGQISYETVSYGENSTKDIVMTPDTGYEITKITINGEEISFKANTDGTYTIAGGYFTNMKEDKHIIVTYATQAQIFTVEKVDASDNTKKLEGAKFVVTDYLDEWAENKLGNLTPNGKTTTVIDRTNEITGVVGDIQNNDNEYTFDTINVTPEGGTTYKTYESNNVGVLNSTAYSYFPIDLTNHSGKYTIAVTAKVSSYNLCYGYATITTTTDDVEYNVSNGRFIYIDGANGVFAEENEYTYTLEGNQKYYLHIGYRKSEYAINADDKFTVTGIKVYGTKEDSYSFEEKDGKYVSTNKNVPNSVSNSYIPIDLRNVSGKYKLAVNAEILSETNSGDFGYATLAYNTEAPVYSNYSGRFMYISGNVKAKDYTTILVGGNMYYLHLGYYKNNGINVNEDVLQINSVKLSMEKEDNFYTEVITNEDGIAKFGAPSNKKLYILETQAPEGYTPIKEYTTAESSNGSVTIENTKKTGLIVHHYLKGTTNKVALDENYVGNVGEDYSTSPKLDLKSLTLEKDSNGKYVIPTNASGKYTDSAIEVTYYYEVEPITLTIHHYLDGTESKLVEDEVVETDTTIEFTGEAEYTVTADANYTLNRNNNYNNLTKNYNLTSTTSTIQEDTTIEDTVEYTKNSEISYYYETKEYEYSVHYFYDGVEDEDEIETVTLNEATEIDEYMEKNKEGYRFDRVKALDSEGKEVDLPLQITDNEETNVINVYYVKNNYAYEIHYFYDGVEDTTKTENYLAYVGTQINTYKDKNKDGYKLDKVEVPSTEDKQLPLIVGNDTSKNIINVYYVRKPTSVLVHHYIENTTTQVPSKTEGVTVADELKEGQVFDEYETSPSNKISNKYELVETKLPTNAEGTMTEEQIVVIYYYKLKDAKVTVKYLEKGTNEVLATEEVIDGKVDDTYTTTKKTIENYTYVEDTKNTRGTMTIEPIEVIYYYLQNTSAKVEYIDKITGKILNERTENGLVGDIFETTAKDFENYILVEEPEEKSVPMEKDEIVLRYYYIHIAGGVIEKHIDIITEEILDNAAYEGNEGDEYEILSKEFEGYDLVEDKLPENSKGTMTVEPIEVKYYYIRRAKVEVEYIDQLTGEKLTEDELIEGHEKDKYETEEKEFEGYDLVEVPENSKGTMEVKAVEKEDGTIEIDNTIKVTYYYIQKSAGVIERHYDITTNELIEEETKYTGHVEDEYKTKAKTFEKYDLVEEKLPENAEGKMTLEEIIVNYYYLKKSTVIVRYVDKETGKDLIEENTIEGHIGDEYKTKPEEIEGYKLVTEELPQNVQGKMTEEKIEVIYYYQKIEEKKDNTEEKEDETPTEDLDTNEENTTEEKEYKTPDKEYKTPDNEVVVEQQVVEKQQNPYTGDDIIKTVMVFMLSVVLIVLVKILSIDSKKE